MEGVGHRGRWSKKAAVGTKLLFMCMFIPNLALLQPSEEKTCPHGDYPSEKGICCNKCSPGFKLVEECNGTGQRSNCVSCPDGQYTDEMNYSYNCRSCKRCKTSKYEYIASPCKKHQNTICKCMDGYYRSYVDSEAYECRKCSKCNPDEEEQVKCTSEKNTVCGCKENYYKVNGKCEPCKTCTTECKHLCPPLKSKDPREDPDTEKEFPISIVAGVAAVALVLLVLVALITHKATIQFTKRKLQRGSSQPSEVSNDSCKVLIPSAEPLAHSSVQDIPQSPVMEQEPSNLPDCVPLEIKIPDLIYTLLDLVPVPQVKQLVRLLDVTDTQIEQAELDHRSCQEAHYQMLRVWAERRSHAGGGRRGGMLHRPLLQELLDKLRMMHLGRAAEELETKYGIQ